MESTEKKYTPEEIASRVSASPVLSQISDLQQSDLLKVLNGAYIARRFFGKSRFWFSKKINHCMNNGKPEDFTPEERKKLAQALRVLSYELDELAETLEQA